MKFEYQSNNIILRVLTENNAHAVLDFYSKNKNVFNQYEIQKPDNFYTLDFQRILLRREFNECIKGGNVRFFLFDTNYPDKIIGTISFFDIKKNGFFSCQIGYKIDADYVNQGYGYKMLSLAMPIITTEYNIHRFEAYVLPNNTSSIRLLEKCDFFEEGITHSYVMIDGNWEDHLRYAYITTL